MVKLAGPVTAEKFLIEFYRKYPEWKGLETFRLSSWLEQWARQ